MKTNSGKGSTKRTAAPRQKRPDEIAREKREMAENGVSVPSDEVSGDGTGKPKTERVNGADGEFYVTDKESMAVGKNDVGTKPKESDFQPDEEREGVQDYSEIEKERVTDGSYDFDFNTIPDYVQYDMIPLPSNGQCYPHKKSRIPVAYLTAMDENIMASPNMYRDGRVMDVILERKVLDPTIDVSKLCTGDRDAIALWLRATGYGVDFPIVANDPSTGKQYNVSVDLSQFKSRDFNLTGDENGWFDYETSNGDKIKFTYISKADEDTLKENIANSVIDVERANIIRYAGLIKAAVVRSQLNDEDRKYVNDAADDIAGAVEENVSDEQQQKMFPKSITEQMLMYTKSVNGNEDPEYIRSYVENMRSKEALDYRNYILNNRPGLDLSITINVPESDGGGSFDTFLRLDDSVFINF